MNQIQNWMTVPEGAQDMKLNQVPAWASIGTNPGAGGTMDVLARISDNGAQFSLIGGPSNEPKVAYTQGSFYEIMFVAAGADGVAEWNWSQSQYNTPK